jgi:uncharacterized integral membrane protein
MLDYWKGLTGINKIKFIFSLLIGIVGVVFATLNWNAQEVHLIFTKKTIPLTLVIIFSIIVGYAMAAILNYRKFRLKDKEIENLQKELDKFKKEA